MEEASASGQPRPEIPLVYVFDPSPFYAPRGLQTSGFEGKAFSSTATGSAYGRESRQPAVEKAAQNCDCLFFSPAYLGRP